jgi:hypothetical protein
MYAVSGVMQGTLLVMCIAWTYRQRRLGIDDFGRPINLTCSTADSLIDEVHPRYDQGSTLADSSTSSTDINAAESTPLLNHYKGHPR